MTSNKPEKRLVRTKWFCTHGTFTSPEERDRFMAYIAERITKAVRMSSGNPNITICAKNILDRDTNPRGDQMFFVVSDESDFITTDGEPFHYYQA